MINNKVGLLDLALHEISRRRAVLKNRVDEAIEKSVVEMAIENLAFRTSQGK